MRWNPKSPANISMQAIFCGQIKLQKYMQAYYDQFGIKKMMYVRTSMPPKLNG